MGGLLGSRFPLTPDAAFRMIRGAERQDVCRPGHDFMEETLCEARVRANDDPARPKPRLKLTHLACLIGLAALALLPGLGGSSRLTYHEAFVAQGSREILDSGQWMFPTIGGLPWLEKPPLPWWLTAALGRVAGGVDETVARLPSASRRWGCCSASQCWPHAISAPRSAWSPAPFRRPRPGPCFVAGWPRPTSFWPA